MNYFHQYSDQVDEMLGVIDFEEDDMDMSQIENDTNLHEEVNCRRCQDYGCNYCLMSGY